MLNGKRASLGSTVRSQNPCKNAACSGTKQEGQHDEAETGGSLELAEFELSRVKERSGLKRSGWRGSTLVSTCTSTYAFTHTKDIKENLGTSKIIKVLQKIHKGMRFNPQPILMLAIEKNCYHSSPTPKNIWHKQMAFLEIANFSLSVKWVYAQQKTTPVKYIISKIFIQNTDQTNCLVKLLKIQQV